MSPYIRTWYLWIAFPGDLSMFYVDSLFVHSNDGGVEFTLVGGSVPGVSALPSPLESCAYV